MTVLITGSAGFIGFHTCNIFLQKKYKVLGVDNLNSYYSVKLKKKRIDILNKNYGSQFKFIKTDIIDKKKINNIFIKYKPKIVIHLAAQAGVRYSIENPDQYIKSNIVGFFNILDCSRMAKIKLFFYASSSSVYGNNKNFPLSEKYNTDDQLSLYGYIILALLMSILYPSLVGHVYFLGISTNPPPFCSIGTTNSDV